MFLFPKVKEIVIFFLTFLLLFGLFVFLFEKRTAVEGKKQIAEHAGIIADDLWNFNHVGAVEYLNLAASMEHFQRLSVIKKNGEVFEEVYRDIPRGWESVGMKLGLVHRVSMVSVIQYNNQYIGWLEAVWIPRTLATHLLVLCFGILILMVFLLYRRVLGERNLLEERVAERTEDLYREKIRTEQVNRNLEIIGTEFQALLDNSPVGILFVGFDRKIKRTNREITRITGYRPEELIGGTTEKLYPSREVYETYGRENYPILERDGFFQAINEIIRKDGRRVVCDWRGQVLPDREGLRGVVWILEDISTRLKMEDELLKVKKLESIGVLAGGIAHDFNNLLLAILGNISLASNLATGNDKVQELLATAEKASLRARDLTAKLLTFSSGGEPVRSLESLPGLVEDSALFVLSGSNVKCSFEFADDLWPAKVDRGQMSQVIQNLVLNADQAMNEGGSITISCSNIPDARNIVGLHDGPHVCIEVRDNGSGISSENIEKVFDPYFSTKTKDANKGSGLGLSIVHSIIIKHDGAISVKSTPGEGTRFTIYLPAFIGEVKQGRDGDAAVSKGIGRILVMDDDPIICQVACEMLMHLGYETEHVNDGSEVVALYEERSRQGTPFSAVIMDLTIPGGMGGAEAVRRLLKADPAAKAIVSSGYTQDIILDNYREYGFCAYVSKPYQLHELSRALEEADLG